MELCIKSEAKNGQQHQKWLFAVSEISKIGIGLISIFLLKARVLSLTILKPKSLSLPLKVDTDQFVICSVLSECLPVKILGAFVWDQSGIRIIGIMQVSVCLGAILIPEYLDSILAILLPGAEWPEYIPEYILIPEYSQTNAPFI